MNCCYGKVRVVSAEALEATKKSLEVVTAVHVYSVQPAPVSQPGDVSAQVRHEKEAKTGVLVVIYFECVLRQPRLFDRLFG